MADQTSLGRYEASLLAKGWEPYWDPEVQERLTETGTTCCQCGRQPLSP